MTDRIWAEINAQPLKSPPAWVRGVSGGDPVERLPHIGRTMRLRGQPPCPSCGNKGRWHCLCEIQEEAGSAQQAPANNR